MKVIMNPPYSGNLHLKILREAMQHSDDIVNLSPIRWLEDPLAEYKKNSDWYKFEDIHSKIESLEIIDRQSSNSSFEIASETLGVYNIKPTGKGYAKDNSFAKKIVSHTEKSYKDYMHHRKTEFGLPVCKFHWTIGGKDWEPFTLTLSENGIYAKSGWTKGLHDTYEMIYFDSKEELNNFKSFLQLKSFKYIMSRLFVGKRLSIEYIPFMPTYTHPWTDADLYAYFGLTADEIGIIEKEMA